MQRVITILCVLLVAITQACTSGDRIAAPFGEATYVLTQRNGQPLPVALDADTTPGTVHMSLVADTIRIDTRASLFVGTIVERLDYIGSPSPATFQRGKYEYRYNRNGDEGTATFVCLPPGAPCAFITESFVLNGDSLVITRSEASPTVYRYRRIL
jgi:hypothetical protein